MKSFNYTQKYTHHYFFNLVSVRYCIFDLCHATFHEFHHFCPLILSLCCSVAVEKRKYIINTWSMRPLKNIPSYRYTHAFILLVMKLHFFQFQTNSQRHILIMCSIYLPMLYFNHVNCYFISHFQYMRTRVTAPNKRNIMSDKQ
jgi:hypothetical protein